MPHVSVKFVLTFIVVSEVSLVVIKLTQDALKELIEMICCKYYHEVATHLNVPLQDKLVANKEIEVGHSLSIQPAGREHPWARRFRLLVYR